MAVKSAEEAYEIVKDLPPSERRRLVERIVHDLPLQADKDDSEERYDLRSLAGIAPNLLGGEDAQEWVTRTRREADEHRRKQWESGRETP